MMADLIFVRGANDPSRETPFYVNIIKSSRASN